ncbi:MAG TPA: 2-hydroxyacyl-CoA dehydratase family protein [Candidatus Hydrogenedentes bacterium]|nr:2-hydroxyacyl-CoA dehydratase family protein [Candidatus Hydrogenedentota bacterium]
MSDERVPIRSYKRMKEIMTMYYGMAKMSEGTDQKIAWITSGGPVEILYAAGITPIYPENHAAMCGATKIADSLCAAAEERGFSRDLCSYARTDFGSIYTKNSPVPGGLPKPDLLVCCNNICDTVTKWYQELQRIFKVPLFFIDAPYQYGMEDGPEIIDYVKAQLEEMITGIGELFGKPIDPDKLNYTIDISEKAAALWREIQGMLAHKPAPMNSFDTFIHLAPIVTLRGTELCIEYYEQLRDEMKERIELGIASVPGEKYRLGWDNLAIWFKIKELSDKFAVGKAALVVSTYPESFCYQAPYRDENDKLRSLAATYIGGYINHGLDYRERDLLHMVEKFSLDGFVMHSNRSCRAYSFGQYELAKRLMQKHGIPSLMLEADMNDSRAWSDEQANTRIEAFLETLAARKN